MAAELTPVSNATQAVRTNKQALILKTNVTVTSGFENIKHVQTQTRLPLSPRVFYSNSVWHGIALSREHRQRAASRRAVNTSPTNPLTPTLRMRILALLDPVPRALLSQVRWGVGLDDLGLDAPWLKERMLPSAQAFCQVGVCCSSTL